MELDTTTSSAGHDSTSVDSTGNAAQFLAANASLQRADSDLEVSDDDQRGADPRLAGEEADSVIGVSIGRAQSHYKSATTPAAERSQVLQDSRGAPGLDDDDVNVDDVHHEVTEPRRRVANEASLVGHNAGALPRQVSFGKIPDGREPPRSDSTRSILRDTLSAGRRRSSSGAMAVTESFKKLFNDMPSLSLPRSPSFASFNFGPRSKDVDGRPRRSNTFMVSGRSPWQGSLPRAPSQRIHAPGGDDELPHRPSSERSSTAPKGFNAISANQPGHAPLGPKITRETDETPSLRRATSDNSLYLRRELSKTSTLDDYARWENVQEQVNSRLKAIKDSFQDSAFRNLSRIPNVDLSSFKPPFIGRPDSGFSSQPQQVPASYPAGSEKPTTNAGDQLSREERSFGGQPSDRNTYPSLTHAMTDLTGDVVVLGGYRGSILRSAKPPHMQVWAPVKVGLNLRKVDLEVGLTDEDEETMEERIIPSGTLSHVGPIDICRRLLKKLGKCHHARTGLLRVHDYGYDWRLNPNRLVRKFIEYLEGLQCNNSETPKHHRGAFVIAHSLGGLIVRSAVNKRPDLFAGVIYAGVPQHCVNILGPLRNGDDVLFSSRVLTAQVNFTLRTSYALMPETGMCFFNGKTKERYDVDFFDANTWEEYRLTPCLKPPLPPYRDQDRRGLLDTVSSSIASLPKLASTAIPAIPRESSTTKSATPSAQRTKEAIGAPFKQVNNVALEPYMNSPPPQTSSDPAQNASNSIATRVTIPHDEAFEYLRRTLPSVLDFKLSCTFNADHQSNNVYPPAAVLYGKSVPTVYGARVASREAIKHSDAYDDLAFATGDGVVLAKAAMLPDGYKLVKDGLVKSERGHVGLLGDLEGVGKCLLAVIEGRKRGIGLGNE